MQRRNLIGKGAALAAFAALPGASLLAAEAAADEPAPKKKDKDKDLPFPVKGKVTVVDFEARSLKSTCFKIIYILKTLNIFRTQ